MKNSKKIVLILLWFVVFCGLIATMNFCSFTNRGSKRLLDEAKTKTYDIIIVPGVPFENGQWSKTMKARVYWSKYLYDKGIAKNVMYSGSAVYTPYAEAEIMALYGVAIGIKKENILTETKAEHSTENLYYSYKKAKSLGFKSIALASDPFQTKALSSFAKKRLNNEVALIPIVFDSLKAMTMTDPTIDFKPLFVKNFIALPARENLKTRLQGTMGKHIDTMAYSKPLERNTQR